MLRRFDRLDGVAIGVVLGFDEHGAALVVFAGNEREEAVAARSTIDFNPSDVGRQVALVFEGGDSSRPLVIGRIMRPGPPVEVTQEKDRIELRAEREVTLRCGAASITLTHAGKVLIRGTYISSWSDGAHRIKGGSIHLN